MAVCLSDQPSVRLSPADAQRQWLKSEICTVEWEATWLRRDDDEWQ